MMFLSNNLLIRSIEYTLNLIHGFTSTIFLAINEENSTYTIAIYNSYPSLD